MWCGLIASVVTLYFAVFTTMLLYWHAFGVAFINPVHVTYGALTGAGLQVTVLAAILTGRTSNETQTRRE